MDQLCALIACWYVSMLLRHLSGQTLVGYFNIAVERRLIRCMQADVLNIGWHIVRRLTYWYAIWYFVCMKICWHNVLVEMLYAWWLCCVYGHWQVEYMAICLFAVWSISVTVYFGGLVSGLLQAGWLVSVAVVDIHAAFW